MDSRISVEHAFGALSSIRIIAYVILLTTALAIITRGIYSLYFSPLRTIPGPWYAAFSEVWILFHTFRCRKVRAIDDLYKAYGPVVRISPNTVAFLDQQTTRYVYNGLKLDKGPLYNAVKMIGHLHSVAIIEHNVHAKYRRIYSAHYAPGNIALLHPDMKVSAQVLVEKLLNMGKRHPVDIFPGVHLAMIDLILKSSFGHHEGALDSWSENSHSTILSAIEDYGRFILLGGITPGWIMSMVSHFPNERWRKFCQSGNILFDTMANLVHETLAAKRAGRLDERDKPTLIQRFLAHNESCAPEDVLSTEAMISESMTHLLAGVDASAVLASYILWQYAKQPLDVKKKIQDELDDEMPDSMVVPDLKVLQNLPVLDALFKEGLRIHGPIPTFLERLAPHTEELDILGYKMPACTVIGTQSWSTHRDADAFSDPEVFNIFRWLDPDQPQETMSQLLIPFGIGPRICVGQHLARNAIKTMLAATIRNFDILPCPETNDRTMEMMELFGMFPIGLSCKLNFQPRV